MASCTLLMMTMAVGSMVRDDGLEVVDLVARQHDEEGASRLAGVDAGRLEPSRAAPHLGVDGLADLVG